MEVMCVLDKKEIEVVEILTGTYGIFYDHALQIAKATYGDMTKAEVAAKMITVHNLKIEAVLGAIK